MFAERLWRSIKYEVAYPRAMRASATRQSIGRYLDFYNGPPHSSLDDMTPDQTYFTPLPVSMAA